MFHTCAKICATLSSMRKKRAQKDFTESIYQFIVMNIKATGDFPKTYEIARRCNLNYETVYNSLKVLESRGLIECRTGKRWAGMVNVERRVKRPDPSRRVTGRSA
jgi:predicted transcriptional regulator